MTISFRMFAFPVLAAGAVLLLGTSLSTPAQSATVTKDTVTVQQDVPGTKKVNFAAFDLNHDGRLSRNEVGTELFYIFDTDGNEVIDNIEYTKPMVLTIIPMEKQEITSVDFNDDGLPDNTTFNTDEFFKQSMLARFDKNHEGVSAQSFLNGRYYFTLDDNHDKTVDLKEFRSAYVKAITPSAANPNRYNN